MTITNLHVFKQALATSHVMTSKTLKQNPHKQMWYELSVLEPISKGKITCFPTCLNHVKTRGD